MSAPSRSTDLVDLDMLASSLSKRGVRVEDAGPGAAPWTDGTAIFVDLAAPRRTQLRQLCVQCALLAAGSFEAGLLKAVKRRPTLAARYLVLEAHRALLALDAVLPPLARSLIDPGLAGRTASPADSLSLARTSEPLPATPTDFGVVNVRALLSAAPVATGSSTDAPRHIPRSAQQALTELDDTAQADEEDGEDTVSSPVGGGGGIGKLLQRLFEQVRSLKEGGAPGADAPTHSSRSGARGAVRSVTSSASADSLDGLLGPRRGILYPEWDTHRGAYRADWCTVNEVAAQADAHASVEWLAGHALRKPLARLGMGLDRIHRRAQGDDIDIDAAIESQLERLAGSAPDEAVYVESLRLRRDLSVLILLDVSGSATQDSPAGGSVHVQQRDVAAALTTVLHEVGDRVSLYAFHSQGRQSVNLTPVKRFDEALDSAVMRRLFGLVPGAYSRLGAAIRHGASVLIEQGGTSRRLLVVLSDGLAYDHGYEPGYGRADARKALAEARRDGVGCLCLSVGASTDTESLRRIFGSAAHASVPKADRLAGLIGPLFRSALRNGEAKRRIA
ncbi:nitric oxide reductase activation protein NorD [Sinimarinibacterium flocculans]|uniref:von Willebrand factor type A domain-containing protein n=1 Tax=Sinimarinibacterium flocculans TaxID=985250 RepID=A0A318EJK5_9GAMM|nr:VWA domain-containing protein [Sinimarinibacterium flocculans]PXV71265.1 von Willebrand factor type A domain-containing protein [Sinimarinibacterium flocculans]